MEIKKMDWKLFRERISDWQERYMEKLVEEYAELLASDADASEKFWSLDKRLREDKKHPGVQMNLNKGQLDVDLVRLVKEGVVEYEDLDGFSDELVESVKTLGNLGREL